MISYEDNDYQFWLEITSNKKIILKTSIHHMETNNFTGLLRIDFKGAHKNPEEVKHTVPEYMKKYAGSWINYDIPHIHIFVEGYRPLVWAIPLEDTDFPVNQLTDMGDLPLLINSFANKINLSSMLNIQQAIF